VEKSIQVLKKSIKSPGDLFLKKDTNPVFRVLDPPPGDFGSGCLISLCIVLIG